MTNSPDQDSFAYPPPPPIDSGAQTVTPAPPTEIVGAFWAYLIAALTWLIGGLLVIGNKQQIADALRSANNQGGALTEAQIETAANVGVILVVVVAVVISSLYALFAFKLKAGRNWARIVLTVLAALALISLLLGTGGNLVSYIGQFAAIVAAVLSFLPSSSEYIAQVKASRQLR
jgi:ABC-type transport system involved in cytochrome bd biosynthesis fused ATPase/permease subunit